MTEADKPRPVKRSRNRATVRHKAARVAAIQALYQMELNGSAVSLVIEEFRNYRLGDADKEASGGARANEALFEELVRGVVKGVDELDSRLSARLNKGWTLDRLEIVLRCILRAATYELLYRIQTPAAVIVTQYVDLAGSFFSGDQPGLVNGILDAVAREARPGELERRRERRSDKSG
jgi:N utilization substance protein B